jgi:hypothetical protein
MNRWDIINHFIKKNNYKSYLEIGYYKGWSFDQVICENKEAVDPNPCKTIEQESKMGMFNEPEGLIIKATSDQFFNNLSSPNDKWDIIFIDGLHESEQVYKDIMNSLDHLSEGGTIILHDCNPPKYEHTTTGIDGCWTGDTYKAFIRWRYENFEQFSYTIDTDWGCGIINPNFSETKIKMGVYIDETDDYSAFPIEKGINNWSEFDEHRKKLLNLISVEEFLDREKIKP